MLIPICAPAQTWTQTSAPNTNWQAVASSADGAKLVAVVNGGPIYASENAGGTWTQSDAPGTNWAAVASSADGVKLVAVASGGGIYVSTNSGLNWTATSAPIDSWSSVTSSADGTKVIAAAHAQVYISWDSGASWRWSDPNHGGSGLAHVACSADGNTLIEAYIPPIYLGSVSISFDSGFNWSFAISVAFPFAVACSADGSTIGVGSGFGPYPGNILTSTNGGSTWTTSSPANTGWGSIACSADGKRVVAAGYGAILISDDAGLTWGPSGPTANWSSVASSADGCKLVGVVNGGGIYAWQTTPAPALIISPSGSSVVLSWIVPSLNFVLQQNTDLTMTNWTDVPGAPTLNLSNLHDEVRVSPTNGSTFYRLER